MLFRRFHLALIARVALLTMTVVLLAYLLLATSFYATMVVVAALAAFQVYALVKSVDRTNQEITRFLQAIAYADFSQSFTGARQGAGFDELHSAFARVIDQFRTERSQKEESFRELQTVVEHVGVGLLTFTPDGEVELMNRAAKRLLHVGQLRNIRQLAPASPALAEKLQALRSGERALVRVEDEGEAQQLALYAAEFKMRDRQYTLVSLQNIRSELEEKEMEAWQNLIRVLTHEIMNSITPISSLASTVRGLLGDANGTGADAETLRDVRGAVQTIEKRSQGLLHFVDAYRNLTRVAKPAFAIFPVAELFGRVQRLMHAQLPGRSVTFTAQVDPESLELTADPEQIEQVLINLLLNALQAVEGRSDARIELRGRMDQRGRVVIEVADNGPGIPKEVQEKIFVPFFTTKKEGTGIGLSLSRQIMRLHRGSITVHSEPGQETVFALHF